MEGVTASLYVDLTQARVFLEEETPIEKMSPSDQAIGKPMEYFLN